MNVSIFHAKMSTSYDVVISFDTTGSMSQCLREVRRKVQEITLRLFKEIPNIRIGIVAHGDYCDEKSSYLMKHVDLSTDSGKIVEFIQNVGDTGGGDFPEAYEYVLREVQKLDWSSDSMRALVMIGDAYPHAKEDNPHKIDWKEEVQEIKKMAINIYSIQALDSGNGKSYTFYKQMAQETNGYHLKLDQFSYINDMLMAVCFHQMGTEALENYEQEMKKREYGLSLGMRKMFDTMLKRKSDPSAEDGKENGKEEDLDEPELRESRRVRSKASKTEAVVDESKLSGCPPAKYQILQVDEDCSIKSFVESRGLKFKVGKGFYEFTKIETIGSNKEVVLMKKATGELFEGETARAMIGLCSESKKYKPSDMKDYRVFIQSTSYNRKLVGGTGFLYEAEDFGRE